MNGKLKVFLLKIKARCNINCTYCYEYNSQDQSWRDKPSTMSEATLIVTIERIADYVKQENLQSISIVFHGGEPLLAPLSFFRLAVSKFREILPNDCVVNFSIQTNGTLITEELLDEFMELGIVIGVSFDGNREINDKYRVDFKGKSTFDKTLKGVKLLNRSEFLKINGGILPVIDPATNPIEVYNFFKEIGANYIDFLMPQHNHINPPKYPIGSQNGSVSTWLITVFDYWYDNDEPISIRLFEHIMHPLVGGKYSVECLGIAPVELIVVQTDGGYEAVDSLKSTFSGAVHTGKDVFSHSFEEALSYELIGTRLDRVNNLCDTCLECDLVKVCGGGHIASRYSNTGFKNPSVYCGDWYRLITHIKNRISEFKEVREIITSTISPIW